MYKKIALSLCFTLFLGLLTSCSPDSPLRLIKNESNQDKTHKTANNSADTITIPPSNEGISSPVAIPPSFKNDPLKPGQTNTAYMPNGLPALKPMKGINADELFTENIRDSGERFSRVENAVVDLRKEFEAYRPSIVRLAAVESDIQNLITELEVLLQETPANQLPVDLIEHSEAELKVEQLNPQPTPPPEPQKIAQRTNPPPPPEVKASSSVQPQTEPDKKPPEKPAPSKSYDGVVATDLRVGEHADKVRIVLETNHHTDFSIDLDNNEKLIIIELPKARWVGQTNRTFEYSELLESYSVEPLNDGNGSMVVMSLKKATSIMLEKRLSPDSSTTHHRIYFDLKP